MEKKILTAVTIVFFIVMLAFTFISRKTAIELLPRVEAVYAEDGVTFPATAVYTDQWGNSCVYAIVEEKSILGTVEAAHKINVEILKEQGEENFLIWQNHKCTCPKCGKLRTVHYDYCIHCKQQKLT